MFSPVLIFTLTVKVSPTAGDELPGVRDKVAAGAARGIISCCRRTRYSPAIKPEIRTAVIISKGISFFGMGRNLRLISANHHGYRLVRNRLAAAA